MAEDLSFGTAVLTSKSPREAAAIIPNCLTSSRNLVERSLLIWFNNYHSLLQKQNQELKVLYNQGSSFFNTKQNYQEFGSFSKTWNCLLNSLQTEIHANEANYKSIKLDIIGPLKDIITSDVRYSELIVNSEELQEVADNVSNDVHGSEYQWNLKAPQTFENFQNFKKFEKQLLFDIILNFFNLNSQRYSKNMANNEESVDYLLSNFKIDKEMDDYLKFLLRSEFQPVPVEKPKGAVTRNSAIPLNAPKPPGASSKSDNHSVVSSSSSKGKKTSKLKSKVGSIFGRKSKKTSKLGKTTSDSIPEALSVDTSSLNRTSNSPYKTHTRNDSFASRGTSVQHSIQRHGGSFQQPQQPAQQPTQQPTQQPIQQPAQQPIPIQQKQQSQVQPLQQSQPPQQAHQNQQQFQEVPNDQQAIQDRNLEQGVETQPFQYGQNGYNNNMSNPREALPMIPQAEPLTPGSILQPKRADSGLQKSEQAELAEPTPYREDSPNVIKYDSDSSSDEDEDELPDVNKRSSMLQKHELVPHSLDVARSNQSSPGKYSFVVGDDEGINSVGANENNYMSSQNNVSGEAYGYGKEYPEPSIPSVTPEGQLLSENSNVAKEKMHAPPPPPPPSRKAHPSSQIGLSDELPSATSKGRRDVHSQMFHNLPNARESFIQPPTLVSQDTGSSLSRSNVYFKHFETNQLDNVQGLTSSIAEVVNATFKDGKLSKSQLIGEIVFNYRDTSGADIPESTPIKVIGDFDKVILNKTVINEENEEGTYKLDIAPIMAKSLGALKYLTKLNESQVPFTIHQIWKFEDHQSSLMLNLTLNNAYSNLSLSNVIISVALDQGVETTTASSRPQGSFNKERNRITWRYPNPIQLSAEHPEEKLIARFLTNGRGKEHDSGIQVKFHINNSPLRVAQVLYADSTLDEVPTVRSLTAGNYSGHYL